MPRKIVFTRVELRSTGQEKREGGRARLLAAARDLFSEAGFGAVSVAQLLEKSDLKAPSLYHHYQDKEGLYVAWVKESLEDIRTQIALIESAEEAPRERLMTIARMLAIEHAVDLLQVERDLRVLKDAAAVREIENALFETVITPVRTAFLEGMALGQISRQDPRILARAYLHGVMTFHPAYFREDMSVEASVDWYVHLIWQGASMAHSAVRL